nr:hypothetical protein [Tanacetum cinerariifolium]
MTMRQFILDLGLYTPEEMGNNLFMPFYESCFRSRPHNYDPTKYVINITTRDHCDTRHPPSYTSIRNLIRRLVHRLLALSDAGRNSRKEKVTLDDLFLFHSMDGRVSVDVPWHVAKFFIDKGKRYKKKSLIVGAHLIDRIARLRAMDERLGDIDSEISRLVGNLDELTYVVSGMSEQHKRFHYSGCDQYSDWKEAAKGDQCSKLGTLPTPSSIVQSSHKTGHTARTSRIPH